MENKYRFFGSIMGYLKKQIKYFFIILIFIVVFSWVTILYHQPLEPVYYALVLSCAVTFVIVSIDCYHFIRKHEQLRQMIDKENIRPEELPSATEVLEEDYQELFKKMRSHYMELLTKTEEERRNGMDYYTMWAHQIKVPISAMGLVLQTDEVGSKKESIQQELFKIEQYVEMVLYYLRMETMSQDLLLKEYDLEDLVKQAVRKYALLFIHKKLSLNLEELGCLVITDEKWLVFVLEQILSNAVKYTKTGTISIYMDDKAPKTLVIEDTGIGIEQEDIPRVFDRGFTGYNGRMNKKSTGIGLYLSKQILSKLSHSIKITSEVGVGTKVMIGLEAHQIEMD